jgi:starch-binding outer membrane protein, SusD/RagB family
MKRSQIYIWTIGMLFIVLSSCSKSDLDLLPTDSIVEENAFQSVADLQRGLNTVYARYANYENTMFIGSLLADEAKFGRDNGGQGQFVFRFQYSQDVTTGGDVTGAWGSFYSMLEFCNRTLEKIDVVPAANATEAAQKITIRSQLFVLRAAALYELQIRYSKGPYNPSDPGVPVVLATGVFNTPARNTSGEVLAQIESDLNAGLALMPAVTAATFTDVAFNRINTTALFARIALYKREWQKAVDYSTTVIGSNIRPLATAAAFPAIWDDSNTSLEVLFRIKRNSVGIGGTWTTTGGLIYFAPTDKLRAAYNTATDVRYNAYIAGGPASNAFYVKKYFGSSLGGRINDTKVIRIAEMYLIRAEAYAELDGPANIALGAADLNTLRAARITGYVNQVFTLKADLIAAILDERFKELCFEGFRFFDLKRKGLPIVRNASDVDSPNWLTLPADNFRFALPIPVAELQANPNIVQNPGY